MVMEENIYSRFKIYLSLEAQLTLIISMVGIVLWMMFFTPTANAHDLFHTTRHSIGVLACH